MSQLIYRSVHLGSFTTYRHWPDAPDSLSIRLAVAYVCTVAAALVSYPFDVVRRRILFANNNPRGWFPGSEQPQGPKTAAAICVEMIQKEGI